MKENWRGDFRSSSFFWLERSGVWSCTVGGNRRAENRNEYLAEDRAQPAQSVYNAGNSCGNNKSSQFRLKFQTLLIPTLPYDFRQKIMNFLFSFYYQSHPRPSRALVWFAKLCDPHASNGETGWVRPFSKKIPRTSWRYPLNRLPRNELFIENWLCRFLPSVNSRKTN